MKKKEMNLPDGRLNYFYKGDFMGGQFYKMPKVLFSDEFKNLSCESKTLYSILLDRTSLSAKNNWVDEENRVYIVYPQKDIKTILGVGLNKVGDLFKELENYYAEGDGLISRIKVGNAYRIFVKIINNIEKENVENPKKDKNNIKNTENNTSKTNVDIIENQMLQCLENKDSNVWNLNTSNTNINNTENIYTHSVNRSREFTSGNEVLKTYQESDRMTEIINPIEVVHEIYKRKELPYEYIFNSRKMEIAIKHLLDYDTMIKNIKRNAKEDYTESEFKTFANTLITMLTDGIELKNRTISNVKTYYSLIEYIKFSCDENLVKHAYIDQIDFVAISNFRKGSNLNTIRNLTNYMAVCIQDALNTGDLRIMNEINQF